MALSVTTPAQPVPQPVLTGGTYLPGGPLTGFTFGNGATTGTADYTWDPAGHLATLDRDANRVDFTFDAASRLSALDRGDGTTTFASADFVYDGRSYLRQATDPATGATVQPLYDSAGLLHALVEQDAPAGAERRHTILHLAGRPVAQLTQDTATGTWQYLTTDHLGTPLLAADHAGTVTWSGGFAPFGQDPAAGTPDAALAHDLFLRLPGQWETGLWADAALGTGGMYYNVWRWYRPEGGSYTRPDPFNLGVLGSTSRPLDLPLDGLSAYYLAMLRTGNPKHEQSYLYGVQNPVLYLDPLGLFGAAALATAGGACVAVDGPFPFGDVVGVPLLIVAGGWAATEVIKDWWDNEEDCEECRTREICDRLLLLCLENPWQPEWNKPAFGEKKDCGACFRSCVKNNGEWPFRKCPLP